LEGNIATPAQGARASHERVFTAHRSLCDTLTARIENCGLLARFRATSLVGWTTCELGLLTWVARTLFWFPFSRPRRANVTGKVVQEVVQEFVQELLA
jgi:hypothetical protein